MFKSVFYFVPVTLGAIPEQGVSQRNPVPLVDILQRRYCRFKQESFALVLKRFIEGADSRTFRERAIDYRLARLVPQHTGSKKHSKHTLSCRMPIREVINFRSSLRRL